MSDREKLSNKRKLYMKILITLVILATTALAGPSLAGPYVEYSNQQQYTNDVHSGTYNHLRIGFETENGMYFEAGKDEQGEAFETGYKFKINKKLTVNGKWEGSNTDKLRHGIETEIRYTF